MSAVERIEVIQCQISISSIMHESGALERASMPVVLVIIVFEAVVVIIVAIVLLRSNVLAEPQPRVCQSIWPFSHGATYTQHRTRIIDRVTSSY